MSAPTWTILVPTIPRRAPLFGRLMERLLPQLEPYGGAVKVVGWLNVGQPRIAEIRDSMYQYADEVLAARYASFVDDDDLVSEDYAERIMGQLTASFGFGPLGHVGFRMDCYKNGRLKWPVEHNLRHQSWHTRRDYKTREITLLRDFTHVDPIRLDIARRGRFAVARPNQPEDRIWVKQVRPHLHGQPHAFIDAVLYQYLWVPSQSAWDEPNRPHGEHIARPEIDSPYFVWHPESL